MVIGIANKPKWPEQTRFTQPSPLLFLFLCFGVSPLSLSLCIGTLRLCSPLSLSLCTVKASDAYAAVSFSCSSTYALISQVRLFSTRSSCYARPICLRLCYLRIFSRLHVRRWFCYFFQFRCCTWLDYGPWLLAAVESESLRLRWDGCPKVELAVSASAAPVRWNCCRSIHQTWFWDRECSLFRTWQFPSPSVCTSYPASVLALSVLALCS